jgi:hypothetical protein
MIRGNSSSRSSRRQRFKSANKNRRTGASHRNPIRAADKDRTEMTSEAGDATSNPDFAVVQQVPPPVKGEGTFGIIHVTVYRQIFSMTDSC